MDNTNDVAQSFHDMLREIWEGEKIGIVLVAGSTFLVVISIILLVKSIQTTKPIEFVQSQQQGSGVVFREIVIDIEGAVKKPGVYRVESGRRVGDVIENAGGFTDDVDTEWVETKLNRAAEMKDGMKLYIPRKGGNNTSHIIDTGNISGIDMSHNMAKENEGTTLSTNSNLVSVNFASQSELEALSGIGPATATKIINGRPWMDLNDLVMKKAINASTFEKIKDQLSL